MIYDRYVAPVLLVLAFAGGLAFAQNITKGVQLSQDNSGPIGMDAANNVYFPNKLLVTKTTAPVASACGTGTPASVGNDTLGKLTTGGSATTSCVLTFNTAYNVAPACVMATAVTNAGPTFVATTTTTATFNYASATSLVISYICMAQG